MVFTFTQTTYGLLHDYFLYMYTAPRPQAVVNLLPPRVVNLPVRPTPELHIQYWWAYFECNKGVYHFGGTTTTLLTSALILDVPVTDIILPEIELNLTGSDFHGENYYSPNPSLTGTWLDLPPGFTVYNAHAFVLNFYTPGVAINSFTALARQEEWIFYVLPYNFCYPG